MWTNGSEREQALEQIDAILKRHRAGYVAEHLAAPDTRMDAWATGIASACLACAERIAGRESVYFTQMIAYANKYVGYPQRASTSIIGSLIAMRSDVESGYIESLREAVHAEASADILQSAEDLLKQGGEALETAAAVLAGGVLEQHVKQLCVKHSQPTIRQTHSGDVTALKFRPMSLSLRKTGAITQNVEGRINSWYDIRNAAAHGKPEQFEAADVRQFIGGLRDFIDRYPA